MKNEHKDFEELSELFKAESNNSTTMPKMTDEQFEVFKASYTPTEAPKTRKIKKQFRKCTKCKKNYQVSYHTWCLTCLRTRYKTIIKKSRLKRKHRKCAKCKKHSRVSNSSWCRVCISAHTRNYYKRIRYSVFLHYVKRSKNGQYCCANCGEILEKDTVGMYVFQIRTLRRTMIGEQNQFERSRSYHTWLVHNNYPENHKVWILCMHCKQGLHN